MKRTAERIALSTLSTAPRAVADFPGYFVDAQGHVYSAWGRKAGMRQLKVIGSTLRRMKGTRQQKGYVHVMLWRDGRGYQMAIHRLVTSAFHGASPPGAQVDHINRVPDDNRAINLRWVSAKENSRNRIDRSHGGLNGNAALTEQQVDAILLLRRLGKSTYWLASVFMVSRPTVARIVSGRSWAHKSRTAA